MIVQQIKEILQNFVILLWIRYRWRGKLKIGLFTTVDRKCIFEGANKIYPHAKFRGKMGYGTYIGPHCEIDAIIGRFCSFADYVRTNIGVHPINVPYATTSPMFFSTKKQSGESFADRLLFDEVKKPSVIGNDVWVGENVFFTGGLKIGDGAVILAGAVVTKDVPPYAIVGGVPAKIIKYRYDEETIKFLLNLRWWDFDIEWLSQNWSLLCDIENLKEYFKDNCYNNVNPSKI